MFDLSLNTLFTILFSSSLITVIFNFLFNRKRYNTDILKIQVDTLSSIIVDLNKKIVVIASTNDSQSILISALTERLLKYELDFFLYNSILSDVADLILFSSSFDIHSQVDCIHFQFLIDVIHSKLKGCNFVVENQVTE